MGELAQFQEIKRVVMVNKSRINGENPFNEDGF